MHEGMLILICAVCLSASSSCSRCFVLSVLSSGCGNVNGAAVTTVVHPPSSTIACGGNNTTECTGHIPYLVLVWCQREWISLSRSLHTCSSSSFLLARLVPAGGMRRGRGSGTVGERKRKRERKEGREMSERVARERGSARRILNRLSQPVLVRGSWYLTEKNSAGQSGQAEQQQMIMSVGELDLSYSLTQTRTDLTTH